MEPLASIARLSARVGEDISSDEEIALANGVLQEASTWVRHYGRPWEDPTKAPAAAVDITIAAAARGFLNPAGFQMERADAQTYNRLEDFAKGTELTRSEIEVLKPYRVRSSLYSVSLTNPDRPLSRDQRVSYGRGYAPVNLGGYTEKPFPLGVEPE